MNDKKSCRIRALHDDINFDIKLDLVSSSPHRNCHYVVTQRLCSRKDGYLRTTPPLQEKPAGFGAGGLLPYPDFGDCSSGRASNRLEDPAGIHGHGPGRPASTDFSYETSCNEEAGGNRPRPRGVCFLAIQLRYRRRTKTVLHH